MKVGTCKVSGRFFCFQKAVEYSKPAVVVTFRFLVKECVLLSKKACVVLFEVFFERFFSLEIIE